MESQDLYAVREALGDPTWHSFSNEEVMAKLRTGHFKGLSHQEAEERLATFGTNELTEVPRPSFWAQFLDQFRNFLVMILVVASAVSLLLGDYTEAAAINGNLTDAPRGAST